MKWSKRGLIYCPDGRYSWARHTALTPTPVLLDDNVIRVYASFRDDFGVGRIGYVDVDPSDPSSVLAVSKEPVLDIGVDGAFDDNGVILGDVISHNGSLYMYYVGFQLVRKVKFLAFTGLAVSDEGGHSFTRYSKSPVLDRSDSAMYIRAIHTARVEDGVWKIWYATGSEWRWIDGKPYPSYNIRYAESEDGVHFPDEGKLVVDFVGSEYRIGRPRVIRVGDKYKMFYTKGTVEGDYVAGYAESSNGVDWVRMDDEIGIEPSGSGWDSTALSYPCVLRFRDKTCMFYNGNDMGKTGFGYAVLEEW